MKRYMDERGFFLLEAILLSLLLVAVIACGRFFQAAYTARHNNAARITAIFLAQEQLACLAAMAEAGELPEGAVGFRGEAADLHKNGESFSVATEISPLGQGLYETVVEVSWPGSGDSDERAVELRRVFYGHE